MGECLCNRAVVAKGFVTPGGSGELFSRVHRTPGKVSTPQQVTIVVRKDVRVLVKRTTDQQAAIMRAWVQLENLVGSLRGRRFYGMLDAASHQYLACVESREDCDRETARLEPGVLPGGRYARMRLEGEPPDLYALIAPAFEKLARRSDHDPTRPAIEFYRRRNVVDLLLPVA